MSNKIILSILICCLLLLSTACRPDSDKDSPSTSCAAPLSVDSTTIQSSPDDTGNLSGNSKTGLTHVSEMFGRYGTDEGYYYCKYFHPANAMEDSYENLMYIDYASNKQVYLCSKSNCTHSDASCTSYMTTSGAQGLFTYNGRLYRLSHAYDPEHQEYPGLIVSDPDGANRSTLYKLESNTNWLRDFVFGDDMLYADVMVMETTTDSDSAFGFISGTDANSRIYAINLKNGSAEMVYDLTDQKIIGAYDQTIVISKPSDSGVTICLFDVNEHTTSEAVRISSEAYVHNDGIIYYAEASRLTALDLRTGETRQISNNLPAASTYLEFFGDYILCEQTTDNGTISYFAVNPSDGTIHPIDLYLSGIDHQRPVEIMAEWENCFLVLTGYKIDEEYVDWAGVWQEYTSKEYFALIDKADFIAGQANYRPIED